MEQECGAQNHRTTRAGMADFAAAGMELSAFGGTEAGRALERGNNKIRQWKQRRWPEIKKSPKSHLNLCQPVTCTLQFL
jgi:hypothetical protein